MDDSLGRRFLPRPIVVKDGVALVPKLFGNDRLDLVEYPLTLRLQRPGFLAIGGAGIVGAADTFRGRVLDQAGNRRVREGRPVSRPISLLVEHPRDCLLPPMFAKKFVKELPDWCLLRIRDELRILPLVTEGSRPAERLPHLGADWD